MRNNKNNIIFNVRNITLNLKNITTYFTGKEKIITLVSIIIMLSFINIILCSSDIFYNSNVSALTYQTSTNISFTFLPTLNVSLSSDNLTINNLVPGSNAVDSNTIAVNVSTNIAEGYNLFATVGSNNNANNSYNTTSLVNTVDNNYTFTSLSSNVSEVANFTNNTWGYSYSLDSGTTWISGDYDNASTGYNGLPLYTDIGIKLVEEADNTSSTVDFKIAAKASSAQPSGEYTNVINFTVISNTIPTTMLDAFIASGAQMYKGYFKMQDMTPTICRSIDTDGEKGMQLIDVRDGKVYWVAKLADDNCWMTQNLELDLDSTAVVGSPNALTSENTNLKTYGSNGYDSNNGYSCSNTQTTSNCTDSGEIITWVPVRTTVTELTTGENSNFPNTIAANSTSYSYNPGDKYYYPTSASGDDASYTLAECESHNYTDCARYKVGNYYNWSASVASNDTSSYTSYNTDAGNSVCPKGWRLPKKTANEFKNLMNTYNITRNNALDLLRKYPFYFVRSGYIDGGSLYNTARFGLYWSGTARGNSSSYSLYFQSGTLVPANDASSRYSGIPIRCIAE